MSAVKLDTKPVGQVVGMVNKPFRQFLVMPTRNPIEQEGTSSPPEVQVDRSIVLKLVIGYPSRTEERAILGRMAFTVPDLGVDAVITPNHISEARKLIDEICTDDKIKDYVVDLTFATREPTVVGMPIDGWIHYGAPLATTAAAKASAFPVGRGYVTSQDVREVAMDVLQHRIVVAYKAEAEERMLEDIVRTVLDHVPVC